MNRISTSWFLILVLSLGLTPVAAQQEQPPDEIPGFFETVDIEVINIDVYVTDRKGNPVTGLTIDDFEIYENRRQQKLTNFYEVRERHVVTSERPVLEAQAEPAAVPEAEAPTPAHLQRRVVFFIDNVSLAPFSRNRVFKAMKEFVVEVMEPGDQAMVVTWNRSLQIRLPFTTNTDQVLEVLETISGESTTGVQRQSSKRQVQSQIRSATGYAEAIAIARQEALALEHDVKITADAVRSLIAMIGGTEGKKALVITSEGFELQPGLDLFYFIEDIGRDRWGPTTGILLEGFRTLSTSVIQSLAHEANAHGVTLYTVHAGGLAGGSAPGSAEEQEPLSMQVHNIAISNSTDALRLMADITGGIATVGTNNFRAAFERIERDFNSYYSLGYRSGTQRVDRRRNIEVRAKNKSYQVRSRRSFVEKSIDTEMSDRVLANLFHQSSTNDLGIFLTTKMPTPEDRGTFRVPVEVHIPIDQLTFLPGEDGFHRGGFSLWLVVADTRNDTSDVQKQEHSITLTDDQLAQLKGRTYIYTVPLILRSGRNTISVGLVDQFSRQRGFARQDVLAKDLR